MDSMWNMKQAGSVVGLLVANHETMYCLTYIYIQPRFRVFDVLQIFHNLVLDQISYGNACSTLWHHVVFCVDYKMKMMETDLYYKTY